MNVQRRITTIRPSLLPTHTKTPAANPPSPPPEVKEKLRHNLRHLLRECSYLPDSWSRRYLRSYVIRRYRDYRDLDQNLSKTTLNHIKDEKFITTRMASKLAEAQQGILLLRRANNGETKSLKRVLHLAYGRVGRRRHELMQPLLFKQGIEERHRAIWLRESVFAGLDVPESVILDALSVMSIREAPEHVEDFPEISPLIRSLAKCQMQYYVNRDKQRVPLRNIEPRVQKLNTWLQPMPASRKKKLALTGYATFLDRLHAPVGRLEWERLRRLTLGLEKEDIPQRRKNLAVKRGPLEVLRKDRWSGNEAFGRHGQKYITPEGLKRLYQKLFALCPKVTWDQEARSFDAVWGH